MLSTPQFSGELSDSLLCSDCAYEDIANPPSAAVARQWKELLDAEERSDLSLKALHAAIRSGVPRGRRADAWRLVMRHRRRQTRPGAACESEESYDELTRKLTSHQHAIIIDVGERATGEGLSIELLSNCSASFVKTYSAQGVFRSFQIIKRFTDAHENLG